MDSQAGPRSLRELSESRVLIFNDGYRTKQAELGTPGFPILRVAQVRDGFIESDDSFDFVRVEFRGKIGPKLAQAGDIVVSTKGTVGRRARLEIDQPYVYSPQVCFFRVLDPGVLDPDYLYYWLGSRPFLGQIDGLKAQTDMAEYVNLRDLARIQLDVPPIRVQRRIASVLRALDDKIELNRRMNQTLEATARAIFKSWFVDFDPVRAKMAGSLPLGMDRETAALFPDSLMDSALGPIPSGWTPGSLIDVVDVLSGGTPSTSVSEYWAGDVPWFTVVDTPRQGDVFVIDTERTITDVGLASCAAELLPRLTTIVTARGTVGNVALTAHPMAMNQSCYGLSGKNGYGSFLTHYLARRAVETLRQRTHGSVFETITRDTLKSIEIVIPPTELSAAFDREIRTYLDRILANLEESTTLAELRDTLLPRLISGETRFPQSGVA